MSRNLLSALLSHSRNILFRALTCHSTFFINLNIILLRNTIDRPFTPDTIVQIFNQNTEQLPQEDKFGNLWRCLHDHFTVSYVEFQLTHDTRWKTAFLKVNYVSLFSVDDCEPLPFLFFNFCVCIFYTKKAISCTRYTFVGTTQRQGMQSEKLYSAHRKMNCCNAKVHYMLHLICFAKSD